MTLTNWANVVRATSDGQVILGDKDNARATAHFNQDHVLDMAEPGGAPGGADRVTELKVYSSVTKHQDMGRGSSKNGGTPTSVGHKYAFGNTEERLRLENLGCDERGHPSQGPLDHATGRGWVRGRRGLYHDALHVKRSVVEVVLHETIGGGFSPPAVAKLHRHARSAASGTDRTRYTTRRKVFSFKSHHSQRISLGIVKADSRGILDRFGRKARSLSRA